MAVDIPKSVVAYLEGKTAPVECETVRTLRARVARLEEALTPNAETKAAYMGEFSFKETYFDEDGEEQVQKVMIPWTAIKCIMKAIARRALEEK